MQFHNSRWKGGEKNVPSIMGVWIFSGITQCRRTFYFQSSLPSTHYSLLFSWREVAAGNRSTFAGYQKTLPFRKKLIQNFLSLVKHPMFNVF